MKSRWMVVASGLLCLAACESTAVTDATDPVLNEAVGRLFPADNWWNRDISQAPVDPDSDALIDWICDRTASGSACDAELHPDFGPHPYGIPYIGVGEDQPLEVVDFVLYGSESDAGATGRPEGYPIPVRARGEEGWIEGGVAGGGDSGDRHLIVVDRDRWLLFELWATRWNPSRGAWEAGSGAVFDLSSNDRRPEGWTSADAAGLAVLPGLIKAHEVESGDDIRHAFRVTTRATNGHVWPASHTAGSTSGAPPLGARLRLKASFDESGFPDEVQRIFVAMKRYGLIIADNGSDMFVQGTMDDRWDNSVLNPAFHALTADDFEVIELGWR
ncbi:MAG: hypothetical protein AAF389_07990 [Gemmatimonadota bacterium]